MLTMLLQRRPRVTRPSSRFPVILPGRFLSYTVVTMSFVFQFRPAGKAMPRLVWVAWVCVSLALLRPLSLWSGGLPEPDLVLYGVIRDVSGGGGVRLSVGTLSWTFGPSGPGTPIAVAAVLTNINDQFSYVVRIPCETPIVGFAGAEGTLSLGTTYDRSQVSVDNHAATFVLAGQRTLTLASTDRGRIAGRSRGVHRRFGPAPRQLAATVFRAYGGGSLRGRRR